MQVKSISRVGLYCFALYAVTQARNFQMSKYFATMLFALKLSYRINLFLRREEMRRDDKIRLIFIIFSIYLI